VKGADEISKERLAHHRDVLLTLARLSDVQESDAIPSGSAQFVIGEAVAALPLGDVIDLTKERARLQKEMQKMDSDIAKFDAKLANEAFVARAPTEIIEEQKEKRADAASVKERLGEALRRLTT
jgi:valyl-tRNA synthetase